MEKGRENVERELQSELKRKGKQIHFFSANKLHKTLKQKFREFGLFRSWREESASVNVLHK